MHIMLMVLILVIIYFFSLIVIFTYRDKINIKIGNLVFVILNGIIFGLLNLYYYNHGGLEHFLTLDNISPMMFTTMMLIYFMHPKVKDCYLCAASLLSFGMFIAMLVNPNFAYLFNFKQQATLDYMYDSLNHLIFAVFGVYLVITKQVKIGINTIKKAAIWIYSIVTFGVILNFVFHKSFFGMNPYGKYSIYMLDIFGSFWITLLAYYLGIFVVLILGSQFNYLWECIMKHDEKKNNF